MMNSLPSFDHLKNLYDTAPEAFEALRAELVQNCIDSAPENRRRRLQGLQFHIDARRSIAKTPMDSCITISKMMHEKFWGLHDSLEDLSATQYSLPDKTEKTPLVDTSDKQLTSMTDSSKTPKSADILHLSNLN